MGISGLLIRVLIAVLIFGGGFTMGQFVLLYQPIALSPSESVALAPPSHVDGREILVTERGVLILVDGARVVNYDSTDSMVPILDEDSNGIVVDADCGLIEVGDIVSYRNSDGSIIVHRVVSVLQDGSFLVKGDNSPVVEEISCEDVVGVLVGVVY